MVGFNTNCWVQIYIWKQNWAVPVSVPTTSNTSNEKCRKINNTRDFYVVSFSYICGTLSKENIHYLNTSYTKCFQELTLTSLDFLLLYLRSKHLVSKFFPAKPNTLTKSHTWLFQNNALKIRSSVNKIKRSQSIQNLYKFSPFISEWYLLTY